VKKKRSFPPENKTLRENAKAEGGRTTTETGKKPEVPTALGGGRRLTKPINGLEEFSKLRSTGKHKKSNGYSGGMVPNRRDEEGGMGTDRRINWA